MKKDIMLKIIYSLNEINFYQFSRVYEESIQRDGAVYYPYLSKEQQRIQAEQDMYSYMKAFFAEKDAMCAVWIVDGSYMSVLRMESYRDGTLLSGLETVPEARGKGFGKKLMMSVVDYLHDQRVSSVYSHVDKNNASSRSVHKAAGFETILDHAVYLDGSVSHQAYTLIHKLKA